MRAVLLWGFNELWGLFVDDENLALFSLGLVAAAVALVKLAGLPPLFCAVVVLVGCIAILVDSVLRAARRVDKADRAQATRVTNGQLDESS